MKFLKLHSGPKVLYFLDFKYCTFLTAVDVEKLKKQWQLLQIFFMIAANERFQLIKAVVGDFDNAILVRNKAKCLLLVSHIPQKQFIIIISLIQNLKRAFFREHQQKTFALLSRFWLLREVRLNLLNKICDKNLFFR